MLSSSVRRWKLHLRNTFLVLNACAWLLPANIASAVGHATPAPGAEPTEVVVKLRAGASIETINSLYETKVIDSLVSRNIYVLVSTSGRSAQDLLDEVEDHPEVAYAELDYSVQAPEAHPYSSWAHPYSSWAHPYSSWAHGDSNSETNTAHSALRQVRLPDWLRAYRPAPVMVAVLDTGFDLGHPALVERFAADGYDFVDDDADPSETLDGIDDDGDGQVDEVAGHGTFVSGLVTLLAPRARILPVRVLDADGQGRAFVLAEAIDYALERGANVINLSLSTPHYSQAMENALKRAYEQGVVVVAAAGNANLESVGYPAAGYKVVAVTAADRYDRKAPFANYGSLVDISAPGVNVVGPVPGGYAMWSGTSMAAPLVAGEAALLMSLTPEADIIDDVLGCIEKGTAKIGEGHPVYGGKLGKGRMHVAAALACYAELVPTADWYAAEPKAGP